MPHAPWNATYTTHFNSLLDNRFSAKSDNAFSKWMEEEYCIVFVKLLAWMQKIPRIYIPCKDSDFSLWIGILWWLIPKSKFKRYMCFGVCVYLMIYFSTIYIDISGGWFSIWKGTIEFNNAFRRSYDANTASAVDSECCIWQQKK